MKFLSKRIALFAVMALFSLSFVSCSRSENNVKALGGGIYLINGHRFVDLGLPSGLLWAETNIGAETAEDDGVYYAYGETTLKSGYSWETYKYGKDNMSKYNYSDGKTSLDKEDDVAYVNWGSPCRIPTDAQFGELLNSDNCTWQWTSKTTSGGSSISGYVVASVKNGNSIFLPASGSRYKGRLDDHGSNGDYWSCTLDSIDSNRAYCLVFFSSDQGQYRGTRCCGLTVRPVAEP